MTESRWLKALVLTSSSVLAGGYLLYSNGCQSKPKPVAAVEPPARAAASARPDTFTLVPPTPADPPPPPGRWAAVSTGKVVPPEPMSLQVGATPSHVTPAQAPQPPPFYRVDISVGPVQFVQPAPRVMMSSTKVAMVALVPTPEPVMAIAARPTAATPTAVFSLPGSRQAFLIDSLPPSPMVLSPLPPPVGGTAVKSWTELVGGTAFSFFSSYWVPSPLRLEPAVELSHQWPVPGPAYKEFPPRLSLDPMVPKSASPEVNR